VIYLDHNATTPPSAPAAAALSEALTTLWANPSSVHRACQEVRRRVELASKEAAAHIGAAPREIIFTSGGTESIDLALRSALGAARRGGARPVVVATRVEHDTIRGLLLEMDAAAGADVRWAPVDRRGVVDLDELRRALGDPGAAVSLCTVQWANNETGVVQPVARIAALCARARVPFHCDATQWVGKMPVDSTEGFSYLTFAPHKFHGPKGVGVLWARRGAPVRARLHGAQELGRRGGTENVPAILGAGVACQQAREWLADPAPRERGRELRDRFERLVLGALPDAVVNAGGAERIWNTSNIAFPRLEAEALLLMLSERGICASAGAACSSGSLEPSHVLKAMGLPEALAHGSLRFSLSRETTAAEIDEAARVLVECVRTLRESLPPAP
jgi:cysteine desulfurase